jgi:ATP-dependent DNA helicase RecG
MISLESPIADVLGEKPRGSRGSKYKAIVDGIGLRTVGDLLEHFPRRYLPMGELTRVEALEPGQMLTVVGEIVRCEPREYLDRRTGRPAYRLDAELRTDGVNLKVAFFAKNNRVASWQRSHYAVGCQGVFVGQVSRFGGSWQLTNPKSALFGKDDLDRGELGGATADRANPGRSGAGIDATVTFDGLHGLYPIYAVSRGVDSWDVQRAVTFARSVLDVVPEILPGWILEKYQLPDVRTAYDWIHAPADFGQVSAARRHFGFIEALITQLVLARRRAEIRATGTCGRTGGGGLVAEFDARLPFELTSGQRAVGAVLAKELGQPWPMNRLLQGEVGSGKTVVALRAMLHVVDSGGQAALLAPTEVLAQQHYRSVCQLLGDLGQGGMLGGAAESTQIALLTGSVGAARRREVLAALASGDAGIVIGTHALIEESVDFADLGLVVVDEQHRFGVEQRAALAGKGTKPPHVLVMTATPIPRTVAMTVFGDLEVSTLAELPAGRGVTTSTVVPLAEKPGWLPRVWERISEEVSRGRQAYVVCSRISGDEFEQGMVAVDDHLESQDSVELAPSPAAVVELAAQLSAGPLVDLRVGVLHGRLPVEQKDAAMRAFAAGKIDVLVATTVIEVGVDVPNATVMVVLDADRFGVSQLHQIRAGDSCSRPSRGRRREQGWFRAGASRP